MNIERTIKEPYRSEGVEPTETEAAATPEEPEAPSTSTSLAETPESQTSPNLCSPQLAESIRRNIEAARAPATRRAYDGDWRRFLTWCESEGLSALPATAVTISAYASHLAETGRKPSTIGRAMASISQAHQLAGHPTPTTDPRFREVLKGIRNRMGTARRQARPLLPEDLRRALARLPDDLRSVRNRAMLLIGLAGGFRRSEIVGLDVGDVELVTEGMIVTLRHAKTDQESVGRRIGIPHGEHPETCPVRALRAWLEATKLEEGPLFRTITIQGELLEQRASDQAVNRATKRAAALAGLDPASYSGHSLRAGHVTAATRAGKRRDRIMSQTGHRSERVFAGYVREAELFLDNSAEGIGL